MQAMGPATPANPKLEPKAAVPDKLRTAERVLLAFFSYACVASLVFSLSWRGRLGIWLLNLMAGAVIVLLSRAGTERRGPLFATLRDWLPAFLILLFYRESGLLLQPDPAHRLDHLFIRLDNILLHNSLVLGALEVGAPWIQHYLEIAYFFCYPLVPLGLAAIYLVRPWRFRTRQAEFNLQRAVDQFWTPVLLATLTSYVLFPFFPLVPPRVLFNDIPGPVVSPVLRHLNFWLLNQYSVGACLFPSGHVAAVTAVALALRRLLPRVSIFFCVAALSIALATVYGRYHYAADAIAGAVVAFGAYFLSRKLLRS